MRKLKGKGQLLKCPKCGGDIEAEDRDLWRKGGMTQTVRCTKCNAVFVESWEAVEWEEYGVEAKIKSSTGNEITVCKHLMTISEEDVWAIAEQEGIRIPEDKKDDVIYTVKKFLEGYCYDGAYNIWDAIKDAIKTALEDEG